MTEETVTLTGVSWETPGQKYQKRAIAYTDLVNRLEKRKQISTLCSEYDVPLILDICEFLLKNVEFRKL